MKRKSAFTLLELLILVAIISLVVAVLWSCFAKIDGKTESTSNPSAAITLLFEHEGVKIYRFKDGVRWIYYTDARGRTEWRTEGKTATYYGVETAQ